METKVQSEKVQTQAFHLCREYLKGRWKEVAQHTIKVRQISGGLSNLVFYIGLPDNLEPIGREPASVLLRLFGDLGSGPVHQFRLITETVVFTMLAERNLGPKLAGVFPGGRLEEFIHGHSITDQEMRSPEYSDQIARNLAHVHSLEIPVSKEPMWLGDTMRSLAAKLSPIRPETVMEKEKEAATFLSQINLREEVDWLLGFLRTVASPVVFSHNDLNAGNIMVREDSMDWDPVVFIDYEFAAYNYRGFDLANHFNEWVYGYGNKSFPYFDCDYQKYPSRAVKERWIRQYLGTYEEQQSLHEENNRHDNTINTTRPAHFAEKMDDIMDEVAAFSLASHLLWAVWSCKQAQSSSITFSYYTYAADRLKNYLNEKDDIVALFTNKNKKRRSSASTLPVKKV